MAERRRQRFVGRARELAELVEAHASVREGPRVACVNGSAGVGKTTLARRFADEARARGAAVYWVSGDDTAPNPASVLAALAAQGPASIAELGHAEPGDVLVLDAFEKLAPLARWFFEQAARGAGASLMVLVTSRVRLEPKLRTDLAALARLVEIELANFSRDESARALGDAGVPEALHESVYAFTRGHALSLALVAEHCARNPAPRFEPTRALGVVRALVAEISNETPSRAHRDALYALAIPHVTDLALARALFGDEADALFEWLAARSFVDATPRGLVPHALVRDALFVDLLASDRARLARLAGGVVDELIARVVDAPFGMRSQLIQEAMYARRELPVVREALGLDRLVQTYLRPGTPADVPFVTAQLEGFFGRAEADAFRRWYREQPEALFVVADESPEPAGVYFALYVGATTAAARSRDPLVENAFEALGELRRAVGPGEMVYPRFFYCRATGQRFGPELTPVLMAGPVIGIARQCRFMLFTLEEPERWEPLAPGFDLKRMPARDVTARGRPHGTWVRDLEPEVRGWRDPRDASRRLVARLLEAMGIGRPEEAPAPRPETALLDEAAFARAVKLALPRVHRRHELRESELSSSAMVTARAGAIAERTAALAALVTEACDALAADPAHAHGLEVLKRTYFGPADKHEAIAASLKLPYGTYRHKLRAAVGALTRELWERECAARLDADRRDPRDAGQRSDTGRTAGPSTSS